MGVIIGCIGTIIGAGGGFMIVPLLLLVFGRGQEEATAISLAVVMVNAASGTLAFGRQGRVDFRSGIFYALATIPGAVLGAMVVGLVPVKTFGVLFGLLLVSLGMFLFVRPRRKEAPRAAGRFDDTTRTLIERDGTRHNWSFNIKTGVLLSLGVGFVSSVMGIGGGVIHVPALTYLLHYPVHVATATSQFVLMVTAGTATVVHLAKGTMSAASLAHMVLPLAVGVIFGAQGGAWLSQRMRGVWVIRVLAIVLGLMGLRVLAAAMR